MMNNLSAPYTHHTARPMSMSIDVMIATLPLFIFSAVFFGIRPIIMLAISIVAAIVSECFACLFLKRKPQIQDGSSIITGILITCMVSPLAPLWLTPIAIFFGIVIVKMCFGGTGRNIFNPAAAGMALITTCFPNLVFNFPDTDVQLSASIFTFDVTTSPSIASSIKTGGISSYIWYDILLGQVPGSIGTTAILVLIASAVFLFVRKSAAPTLTLSFLLTCGLWSILFPRTSGTIWQSMLLELCSGYLLFGSIFLLNDPVTTPSHTLGRIFFGVVAAVLVMFFRHFGQYEEGMCFAILLCNTLSTLFDRLGWTLLHKRKEDTP